jgi:multidrug efflux system membrane fusion protein
MFKKTNMKLKKVSLLSFLLVAVLMVKAINSHAQAPPPAPVVVSEVREQTLQKPVSIVGAVEPVKRSTIASEIAGLVEDFPVEEGDAVKKGDLLAKLRTKSLEIDLREAKSQKAEADARYRLAKKNLERFQELYNKGVASLQQLQDAETEKDAMLARLSQLEAQIDSHAYDLARSKIVAPFDGYVTAEHTEVGQWIQVGGPVVELIDINRAEINVDVPERYISQIRLDDLATINFDALPNLSIEGKIASIVPQADRESRTFPIKVVVDNKGALIKSGMVARVSFLIGEPSVVKLVPKDAIVEQNRSNFVYVVNDGAVVPVQVSTGIAFKDLIQITGPVEMGQLVVTRGNERLRPNQPVKIVDDNGAEVKD